MVGLGDFAGGALPAPEGGSSYQTPLLVGMVIDTGDPF
jgi:hypothetical protein